jgi:hypothetical protein
MSGADIPYQLRPNKYIDRQIFIELLSRLIVPRGTEKYVYVSMGGNHLVDHCAVYNQLGIDGLYSFDNDANAVKRQKFNRPIGKAICVKLNSADLPTKIDEILSKFPSKKSLVVWLDYTDTNRRAQFQEAIQTLVRLRHGDIFRITLNANPQTLCGGNEWRESEAASPGEYRANKLREQIEEYMPTDITAISETGLSLVLARCVELATKAAEGLQANLSFQPVLLTSYKDGARMLTVTCVVKERDAQERFPQQILSRWRFVSKKWTDIQDISVPVLSTKEQHRLDIRMHRSVKYMLSSLSFLPSKDEKASIAALKSYRKLHRYYPSFRHVED